MPSYDYECARCGVFSATRPIALYDRPAPCPACGSQSPRTLTAPMFASAGSSRFAAESVGPGPTHPGGCSCCRPRPAASGRAWASGS